MSSVPNLTTDVLLRSEETGGHVSVTEIVVPPHSAGPARYLLVCTPAGFERHWARIAADAAGVEPPKWALQPIPEVTVVGPQIAAQA